MRDRSALEHDAKVTLSAAEGNSRAKECPAPTPRHGRELLVDIDGENGRAEAINADRLRKADPLL